MNNQEQEIFDRIKSGDNSAFEKLFFEYYPRLTVFANKYVNDLETARDIVQDFFVRFYESIETIIIHTSLKNYLYSGVRNSCINQINKNQTKLKYTQELRYQTDDSDFDLMNKIETTELEFLIWKEISKLPKQCRNIFELSRREGIKNKEISSRLGISIRTVETQISKALKILRKNLSGYIRILL